MKIKKRTVYDINGELLGIAKIIPYNPFVIIAANIYLSMADKLKRAPNELTRFLFGCKNKPDKCKKAD